MNPEDVQKAIKSLQRFLLDEYGWDTQTTDNLSQQFAPQPVQTGEFRAEYLKAHVIETGNYIISP